MTTKSKVYTKTGDLGETSLVGGTRVSKAAKLIDLYGEVDELNAFLGYSKSLLDHDKFQEDITLINKIQNVLFDLGSNLACEEDKRLEFQLPQIKEELVGSVEAAIDRCDKACPALKNFVLPGGATSAASFHIVRTVCRRVERNMIHQKELLPTLALPLMNRLSDYFFVLSRYVNVVENEEEHLWIPEKK
jgi:cob(I)alamin adenosyltransferase